MRAIFPISSGTTRRNLYQFSGYGTLLNSHVVCVKPVIQDLVFESQQEPPPHNTSFKPILGGNISLSSIPSGIIFDPDIGQFFTRSPHKGSSADQSVTFTCRLAYSTLMVAEEWPISMCVAGNKLNWTTGHEDSGRLNILGTRATSFLNDNLLMDPLSDVLVNYSGIPPLPFLNSSLNHINAPNQTLNYTVARIAGSNWTETENDLPSWTTFKAPEAYSEFHSVSISYCFPHFAAVDAPFIANGSLPNTEPALIRSNASSSPLDARNVTRQLGADGTPWSLTERGILQLQTSDTWKNYTSSNIGPELQHGAILSTTALDGTYGFGMGRSTFTPPISEAKDFGDYLGTYQGSPITATWGFPLEHVP